MAATIKNCGCPQGPNMVTVAAKYQDAKYGQGNRVHNATKDGGARCTVCGKKK